MKHKIILFLMSLLFSTGIYAQNKRQTKFIKLDAFEKHNVKDAKQLITTNLGLTSDDALVKVKTENDQLGFTHDTYQQYFQGVKVEFGIYKAHAKNGNLMLLNGALFSPGKLKVVPTLNKQAAFDKAVLSVGASRYLWESPDEAKIMGNYKKPEGELVVFPGEVINKSKARLAYKFDVYATQPVSRAYIYVDAHSGAILYSDSIIKHLDHYSSGTRKNKSVSEAPFVTGNAATRYSGNQSIETTLSGGNYILRETTRGNGIETYDMNMGINYNSAVNFTDNDNSWTAAEHANANKDNAALDAHWGAEKTYDYFYQTFNRDSYDDNGAAIKSYVHFDLVEYGYDNQDNAFWNGSVMTYGDGTSFDPLTSLDIAAHEIGHAICENTANLTYSYQSGAMNEGFSDIWAASVEYYADPAKDTWLLAEEIGGPIRSLSNPNDYGQPDTYLGTNWYTGSGDSGGVHYNSGVLNHWFYILTVGKNGTNDNNDAYSVSAVGIDAASAIAYRLESVYLVSSSQYADARTGGIQAAIDLFGAGSAEEIAVTNAWYAVGLGDEYVQTCALAAPSNLGSSNIGDNNFTVSWGSVSGADDYTITIGTTANTVSGTTYTASGLASGTTYAVSVVANCTTGGSGSSANSNVTTTGTAPLNYCDSNGNSVSDEYIARVQLGSIDNVTGGTSGGYADNTSISASLIKGASATITVTPTWSGTAYSEGYSVWIDYNQDGDFSDSGEQVWTQSASKTTPVSGTFTVPSGAINGATRMRVSMKYNAVPTSCEAFSYGEVEDYTVTITSGTADTVKPVIALTGSATINLTVGDTYNELGATATDDVDGNLTASISITGTVNTSVAGTYTKNYNVSDAAGNVANQVSRTVVVNPASTSDTAVNLSITFDNYPEETSWTITDGSGSPVASGGTYASQADGSTLNVSTELPVGCYSLTINDAYGDGICCSYGNGSYTLTDGSVVLASGASFASSETTTFCVGGATSATFSAFTSGVTETLDNQFKIYPNPTKQQLNVSFVGFKAQSYEVKNILGQTVLQGRYTNIIDVSKLQDGIYVLQLNIGEKTKLKKFIKQ